MKAICTEKSWEPKRSSLLKQGAFLGLLLLSLACQPSSIKTKQDEESTQVTTVSASSTPEHEGLSFDRLLGRYSAAVSEHDEELWLSTIHPASLVALSGDKRVVLQRQMGDDFTREQAFGEWELLGVEESRAFPRTLQWSTKPTILARHKESIGGRIVLTEKMLAPTDVGGLLILIPEPSEEYVAESQKAVTERENRKAKAASIFQKIPFEAREHIAALIYKNEKMAAVELLRVYVLCDSRTAKKTVEYIGTKSNSTNTIDITESNRAIIDNFRHKRATAILSDMSEKDKRDIIVARTRNEISAQLEKFQTDERVLGIVKKILR